MLFAKQRVSRVRVRKAASCPGQGDSGSSPLQRLHQCVGVPQDRSRVPEFPLWCAPGFSTPREGVRPRSSLQRHWWPQLTPLGPLPPVLPTSSLHRYHQQGTPVRRERGVRCFDYSPWCYHSFFFLLNSTPHLTPAPKRSPIAFNGKRFCGCCGCGCANPGRASLAEVLVFGAASPAFTSYSGCIADCVPGLFRLRQQKPEQDLRGAGRPSGVCARERECAGLLLRWTRWWTLWPPAQGAARALESPGVPQSRPTSWAPIFLCYPL